MITDNKFLQGALVGAAGLVLIKKFFLHDHAKHHHGTHEKDMKSGKNIEHDIGEGYHECECGHSGKGKWHGTHSVGLSDII
jgi:hypothetical protein